MTLTMGFSSYSDAGPMCDKKVDVNVDSFHIFHSGHACNDSTDPQKTSFPITYSLSIIIITNNPALKLPLLCNLIFKLLRLSSTLLLLQQQWFLSHFNPNHELSLNQT